MDQGSKATKPVHQLCRNQSCQGGMPGNEAQRLLMLIPERHLPRIRACHETRAFRRIRAFKRLVPAVGEHPAVGRDWKILIEPSKLMIDELCFLRDCDVLYALQGSNAFPSYSFKIK